MPIIDHHQPIPCVSVDTLTRIEKSCAKAGYGSWPMVLCAARSGVVFGIEFADRRPVHFAREFAALLRDGGLKLCADNRLELYMGTPEALDVIVTTGCSLPTLLLRDLGEIETQESDKIATAGPRRSAGVRYTSHSSLQPLSGVRVLVLDDDAVSRKVLTASLKKAGCKVRDAAEAETAFTMLQDSPPDIVVLDVELGGAMTGFDFCRAIRRSERFASLPAIFVTGFPLRHPAEQAKDVEASAWFVKPIHVTELCTAVGTLARR